MNATRTTLARTKSNPASHATRTQAACLVASPIRRAKDTVFGAWHAAGDVIRATTARAHAKLLCAKGQGTTEYAILVGVLVVIAVLAIAVFKPKIQELWDAIADGINDL